MEYSNNNLLEGTIEQTDKPSKLKLLVVLIAIEGAVWPLSELGLVFNVFITLHHKLIFVITVCC